MSDIDKAIRDMTNAAQDLTSGHRFRRRSISQRHSQCGAVPVFQPEACCASSAFDFDRSSFSYPGGTLGVSLLIGKFLSLIGKREVAAVYKGVLGQRPYGERPTHAWVVVAHLTYGPHLMVRRRYRDHPRPTAALCEI